MSVKAGALHTGSASKFGATTCTPLNHPLRVRVLEVCNERDISPVTFVKEDLMPSGVDFKDEQAALSNVSYAFRTLEDFGLVEVVDRVQRRGATEHIYRGTSTVFFSDEEFAALPREIRETLSRTSAQGLIARMDSAMRDGTFDETTDRHLTWLPMLLDRLGWEAVMEIMSECYFRVKAASEESRERVESTGENAIPATYGMVGFQSPPPPPPVIADDQDEQEKRRQDDDFNERVKRRLHEDADVLRRLAERSP